MELAGETIYDDGWKVADLRALRRDRIGFVFQAPYLIPFLDVTDNVALLPMLAGIDNGGRANGALEMLAALDVGHRAGAGVATFRRRTAARRHCPLAGQSCRRHSRRRADGAAGHRAGADRNSHPQRDGAAIPDRDHRRHPRRKDHSDLPTDSITFGTVGRLRKLVRGDPAETGGESPESVTEPEPMAPG